MTKKDYVDLAHLIALYRDDLMYHGALDKRFVRNFVLPLTNILKRENERFDLTKFLAACDIQPEDPK